MPDMDTPDEAKSPVQESDERLIQAWIGIVHRPDGPELLSVGRGELRSLFAAFDRRTERVVGRSNEVILGLLDFVGEEPVREPEMGDCAYCLHTPCADNCDWVAARSKVDGWLRK